jgi:hypothetical protein
LNNFKGSCSRILGQHKVKTYLLNSCVVRRKTRNDKQPKRLKESGWNLRKSSGKKRMKGLLERIESRRSWPELGVENHPMDR